MRKKHSWILLVHKSLIFFIPVILVVSLSVPLMLEWEKNNFDSSLSSNPYSMTECNSQRKNRYYTIPGNDISFNSKYAYVKTDFNRIHFVDISSPRLMTEVGYDIDYQDYYVIRDILVSEEYLFVNRGGAYLEIFDARAPKQGSIKSVNINEFSLETKYFLYENLIFTVDFIFDFLEIGIIDCSNIQQISIIREFYDYFGTDPLEDTTQFNLYVSDGYLFIWIDHFGVSIYDISNYHNIQKVTTFPFERQIYDLLYFDDFVYIAEIDNGLTIMDFSDHIQLGFIEHIPNSNGFGQLYLAENHLFLTTKSGFSIMDISSPLNPEEISQVNFSGTGDSSYPLAIFVIGRYLFLGMPDKGITVFNIENPFKPKQLMVNLLRIIFIPIFTVLILIIPSLGAYKLIKKKFWSSKKDANNNGEESFESEKSGASRRKDSATQVGDSTQPKESIKVEYPKIPSFQKNLKTGFLVLAIQNILFLVIYLAVILYKIYGNISKAYWLTYLLTIPLVIDLVAGAILCIAFFRIYLDKRNKSALITSILWLTWIGFAITYRAFWILLGFPTTKSNGSLREFYGDLYTNLFILFFLICLNIFWFALLYSDRNTNFLLKINNNEESEGFVLFRYFNLIGGIGISITAIITMNIIEIYQILNGISFRVTVVLDMCYLLFGVVKVVATPVMGALLSRSFFLYLKELTKQEKLTDSIIPIKQEK